MMKHHPSSDDRSFRMDFEACRFAPQDFNHRAHVRLAYTYLVDQDVDTALISMRTALLGFVRHYGIDVSKYHETMTRAWILAVRHFMEISPASRSADEFIERNPMLLDSKVMFTHYSAELLFSPEARERFVEPDLDQIPRHHA